MPQAQTLAGLMNMCQEWRPGDHVQFRAIIGSFLRLCGAAQRQLADQLQVSEASISRWANGLAKPHVRFQQLVVDHVRDQTAIVMDASKRPARRRRVKDIQAAR
jgi:Trp operon repressor